MKRMKYALYMFTMLMLTASCEKDLPLYDTATCRLNFYYPDVETTTDFKAKMAASSYSFVYVGADVKQDTVWFEVESMGFLSDKDRPIQLVQVDTAGVRQAVAGKHFIAFDDPSLKRFYVMPAGKARTKIPVVVMRDASLSDGDVVLKFAIGSSDHFIPGYPVFTSRALSISGSLSKPDVWDYVNKTTYMAMTYYYGNYGKTKHQFLIDQTGFKWDNDFIKTLVDGDSGYFQYLYNKMVVALDQLNAERIAKGLGALSEEDGTPVVLEYGK